MSLIHHSAICVRDLDVSLRFWCDGLGFEPIMDQTFEGDWPTLLRAPASSLRSVFLGDPAAAESGLVELVDLGAVDQGPAADVTTATSGFLLLSLMTDLGAALGRLADLGLGGPPRRISVQGVDMAVVIDPDGVQVELIDSGATANFDRLAAGTEPADRPGAR